MRRDAQEKGNAMKSIVTLVLLVASAAAGACQIAWDETSQEGWLEGIRFFNGELVVGEHPSVVPPVACADVGVTPCVACVYTAAFFRGDDVGPASNPLIVEIGFPAGGLIRLQAQ